jgi:glycosyltransferase involved in cell wall biosynthesis
VITIQILTKNNEKTIEKCLQSLESLDADIIIGDLGSTDNTLSLCSQHRIVNLPSCNNYSNIRNSIVDMSRTDWQMYIEPWESITSGQDQLLWSLTQPQDAYKLYKIQGKVVTKETRVWKKSFGRVFTRPVYEAIEPEANGKFMNCVIAGAAPSNFEDNMRILNQWKKDSPHTPDVDYYLACTYLSVGRYSEFFGCAKKFIFRTKEFSMANLMTNYYMASVYLLKKETEECMKHIVVCLANQPTFAEFWCLLGDIFIQRKQFQRAVAFYENAILFGSKRSNDDAHPIDVSKYKDYPEEMIAFCNQLHQNV